MSSNYSRSSSSSLIKLLLRMEQRELWLRLINPQRLESGKNINQLEALISLRIQMTILMDQLLLWKRTIIKISISIYLHPFIPSTSISFLFSASYSDLFVCFPRLFCFILCSLFLFEFHSVFCFEFDFLFPILTISCFINHFRSFINVPEILFSFIQLDTYSYDSLFLLESLWVFKFPESSSCNEEFHKFSCTSVRGASSIHS